jgi:DNA-binding response OmpR family regulator
MNDLKKSVLVVEDNKSLALILKKEVELFGYSAEVALDGDIGFKKAKTNEYSLIISDISLPGMSGIEIIRGLRAEKIKTPIITITNFNIEDNEIVAYIFGANIFHKKPINFDLLKAQITMLLKESYNHQIITIGDITMDDSKRSTVKDGAVVVLTKNEYKLFHLLLASPGEVFSRTEIMYYLNKFSSNTAEGSIDTLVSRLRK